jgi:hypothetical protein
MDTFFHFKLQIIDPTEVKYNFGLYGYYSETCLKLTLIKMESCINETVNKVQK